jgi:hypothetical protein
LTYGRNKNMVRQTKPGELSQIVNVEGLNLGPFDFAELVAPGL